jgi:O-antigen ligase
MNSSMTNTSLAEEHAADTVTPSVPDNRGPIGFLLLLAALTFTQYLTGIAVIPFVGNNVGPFDLIAGLIAVVTFMYFLLHRLRVHWHPIIVVFLMLFYLALVSKLDVSAMMSRTFFTFSLPQTFLLLYTVIFLLVLYNVLLLHRSMLGSFLRFVMVAAGVAAIWVVVDAAQSGGAVTAVGPFGVRAHAAIYMLSGFWLVLTYAFWPGISRLERLLTYLVLGLCLFPIAVSGRRSVYLALAVGIALLPLGIVVLRGRQKVALIRSLLLTTAFLASFYLFGGRLLPQLAFFQERVGLVGDRLYQFAAAPGNVEDDDNFALIQREAALEAFADRPLSGIGWGGFYGSSYDRTGHEFHGTPLRFLAELGLPGFLLYLALSGLILFGAIRLALRSRGTPYQASAFIVATALVSVLTSHVYNRGLTDRGFWVLLVVFLALDALVLKKPLSTEQPV